MRDKANRGSHNGKAAMDNGYGWFLNMFEYKQVDRGTYCSHRQVVLVVTDMFMLQCAEEVSAVEAHIPLPGDQDLNTARNI